MLGLSPVWDDGLWDPLHYNCLPNIYFFGEKYICTPSPLPTRCGLRVSHVIAEGRKLHLQRAGVTKNFRKKCFQDCSMCIFQILKIFKGCTYVKDHARVLMALGPFFLADLLQIHYRFLWHKVENIHKENELTRRKVFINTRQYAKKIISPLWVIL